jgi:hypothetical protein
MSSSWWWLPWVALASAVGVVPAVLAWRRGRHASALRWIGWAIVPWAAWLLGLVSLVARAGRLATKAGGRPAVAAKADPEDEDIEAILRRHGIT